MPRLSSIADIRMGATLRGRDAWRSDPNGSFCFIRIGDISQDGTLKNDDFIRIEPSQTVNEDLWLRAGDVLFPNRGTRTTAFALESTQPRTIVGPQFFIIRPDQNRIAPEYLAWFLRSGPSAAHFESRRKGTHVQIIERRDLTELEIPLPPLSKQHKIVEAAKLAIQERDLSTRLAHLKWLTANEQFIRLANGPTKSPK